MQGDALKLFCFELMIPFNWSACPTRLDYGKHGFLDPAMPCTACGVWSSKILDNKGLC